MKALIKSFESFIFERRFFRVAYALLCPLIFNILKHVGCEPPHLYKLCRRFAGVLGEVDLGKARVGRILTVDIVNKNSFNPSGKLLSDLCIDFGIYFTAVPKKYKGFLRIKVEEFSQFADFIVRLLDGVIVVF